MAPIKEGSGNVPPQAFQQWNDPQGTKLISLNRDGTVFTAGGITFSDGTSQSTASSGGGGVISVFGRTGAVSAQFNDYASVPNLRLGDSNGALGIIIDSTVNPGQMVISTGSGSLAFIPGTADFVLQSTGPALLQTDSGGNNLTIGGEVNFSGNTATMTKGIMTHLNVSGLQIFANNAAAVTGGLNPGDFYRSGANPDAVLVVH